MNNIYLTRREVLETRNPAESQTQGRYDYSTQWLHFPRPRPRLIRRPPIAFRNRWRSLCALTWAHGSQIHFPATMYYIYFGVVVVLVEALNFDYCLQSPKMDVFSAYCANYCYQYGLNIDVSSCFVLHHIYHLRRFCASCDSIVAEE